MPKPAKKKEVGPATGVQAANVVAARKWPKFLRDPIHNVISFQDTGCDRLLLDLINTREFQRLRRIKQLGFSELVYPAANHSRFAHSIGVMHIARQLLARLERVASGKVSEEQRTLVLVAALIHDLGHGPFSHAFEKITDEDHEERTAEIISDPDTEVHRKLAEFDKSLPQRLRFFFDEGATPETADSVPSFLTHTVTSQLDADRFDYLLRDCHVSGTDYGRFDLEWIIQHLYLEETGKQRLFLSWKGLDAAEEYVHARYHMYRNVYFHKTSRAAEVMFRLLLQRFKELSEGKAEKARSIAPSAPPEIVAAFTSTMTLENYLALDDHSITGLLKACESAEDAVLNSLSRGILNRRLFKGLDVSAHLLETASFTPPLFALLTKKGLDPRYAFAEDRPADTPYKPYDPDAEEPATQIYIETQRGGIEEISKHSEAIAALHKKYTLVRYYFPVEHRDEIMQIAQSTLHLP